MNKVRFLTEQALLITLLLIIGSIKLPSFFPGAEFQLSAPLAVAIAANFGFLRYLTAGIGASILSLLLGTHNFINVLIAMIFRLVAGGLVCLFASRPPFIILAGPLGSLVARLALALFIGKAVWALIITALPGMIFTALTAYPLTKLLQRIISLRDKSSLGGKSNA
jgi:hypothetical protein